MMPRKKPTRGRGRTRSLTLKPAQMISHATKKTDDQGGGEDAALEIAHAAWLMRMATMASRSCMVMAVKS
jgi:hypothetical protein